MAIKLTDKVNTEPISSTWPYGDVRDNPGDNSGTPVDRTLLGDVFQFFERIMALGGVTHNGLPDNNTNGFQFVEALVGFIRNFMSATETLKGVLTLATQAEVNAGNNDTDAVTPLKLKTTDTVVHNETTGVRLATKVIEIGDWNMDSTSNVGVAHGIANFKKIRSVKAVIRNDADSAYDFLDKVDVSTGTLSGGYGSIDTTFITLYRTTGGGFDDTSHDSTSFNRGWITILYQTN